MKNIHVLPTTPNDETANGIWIKETRDWCNIYITNDEEIEKDDYVVAYGVVIKVMMSDNDRLFFVNGTKAKREDCSKIILTDNPDLIKDGVQAIDDEFLEWFVKNSSCDVVEIDKKQLDSHYEFFDYKIIIPKEEPKQETLEGKLLTLVKEWQQRQNKYQDIAEVSKDEHNYKKFIYKAMATRDCWKELLKIIENE